MIARGLIHHIDLTVTDLARSRAFYDAVLCFCGYRRAADHDRGTDWDWQGDGPFHSVGIQLAKGAGAERLHDRYAPGLHHLAWTAADRNDVGALYTLLQSIGAEILDPPAAYPRYGPAYYALFFSDPDGMKLEFVSGATGVAT